MTTPDERERLEGLYTSHRIFELRLNPVRGSFDAAHLREINRRIFQDLPGLGFTDVTPGMYRPPVAPGNDWVKRRKLETVTPLVSVAYSSMDKVAQGQLDTLLKDANPAKLSKLETDAFTQAIGRLYAQADYIHPFNDGNSRSLREFTRQLAQASGYVIAWERFADSPIGRDLLYIARDLSVNALALPHLQHLATKRDVTFTMDMLEGNRDLPDLLRDVIRPEPGKGL